MMSTVNGDKDWHCIICGADIVGGYYCKEHENMLKRLRDKDNAGKHRID